MVIIVEYITNNQYLITTTTIINNNHYYCSKLLCQFCSPSMHLDPIATDGRSPGPCTSSAYPARGG